MGNEASGYPDIPDEIVRHLVSKGYSRCYYALYSTKPFEVLLGVVIEAKDKMMHADSVIIMNEFEKQQEAQSTEIQRHFVDGMYTMVMRTSPRPIFGTYMVFITPLVANDTDTTSPAEVDAKRQTEQCASLLSLMHGEFVALDCHFAAIRDFANDSITIASPSTFIRHTIESEHLNQGIAKIIDEERNCQFADVPKALVLISRAHHESDGALKFLLMWMAGEAILGDGHKRRHFALITMQSEYLDKVINYLRRRREAMVHDGELTELDQEDYLRIKCVTLIALSQNDVIRLRLLEYLETTLAI